MIILYSKNKVNMNAIDAVVVEPVDTCKILFQFNDRSKKPLNQLNSRTGNGVM
jgi:hypothetical protein